MFGHDQSMQGLFVIAIAPCSLVLTVVVAAESTASRPTAPPAPGTTNSNGQTDRQTVMTNMNKHKIAKFELLLLMTHHQSEVTILSDREHMVIIHQHCSSTLPSSDMIAALPHILLSLSVLSQLWSCLIINNTRDNDTIRLVINNLNSVC